jgi:hypothetical protein
MYADVYQDAGGQLTFDEAAAVARWRAATGTEAAAQQAAAAAAEPWVTEQQLQESGMLDRPYYVPVCAELQRLLHYGSHITRSLHH